MKSTARFIAAALVVMAIATAVPAHESTDAEVIASEVSQTATRDSQAHVDSKRREMMYAFWALAGVVVGGLLFMRPLN